MAKRSAGSERKVLLVEDDPFLYNVLKQRLEDEGIEVRVASDGDVAVKFAASWVPDLIVLDLILPQKDGFEVLQELRSRKGMETMPVLVLSNLGWQESRGNLQALGIREYLVKSDLTLAEMLEKILGHLDAVTL